MSGGSQRISEWLGWDNPNQALQHVNNGPEAYFIAQQHKHPGRRVAWCEAQGMAPQFRGATEPYSIPEYSSGGFNFVTAKHSVADEYLVFGEVAIVQIGDHYPNGARVLSRLDKDVSAFQVKIGSNAEFMRLVVTPKQIKEFKSPTAPLKAGDRNAFEGITKQAEALPTDILAHLLRDAITNRFGHDLYQRAVVYEQKERRELPSSLGGST